MLRTLAILIVSISIAGACRGARLLDVRSGERGDTVRVVLDLSGPASSVLCPPGNGSASWSVLLKDACKGSRVDRIAVPGTLLEEVTGRCEGKDYRVFLKPRVAVSARSFPLPARDGKPHRIVVDVAAAGEPPPATNESTPEKEGEPDPEATPPSPAPAVKDAPAPRRSGPWRIFIDPGHGGHDSGARSKTVVEKEVVLDVSKRVAEALEKRGGFDARLSRTGDTFVSLRGRRDLAEAYDADAFISIHVNAAKAKNAIGVEVFFLSLSGATDTAAKELARLENEADPDYVVEEDAQLQGIPFGFDLRQSDTLLRSSRFAETVLTKLENSRLAASRGVKQAGFAVLKSFQVPSILVEIGFLSNPTEAKRLKDPKHRQKIADCIADGVIEYFTRFAPGKAD